MRLLFIYLLSIAPTIVFSQKTNPNIGFLPRGTVLHGNIAYHNDTLPAHLLDIYLPPNTKEKIPLVVFIHGGGWLVNDKYADMDYMKATVSEIINSGYALASIDYRYASKAKFPAQIQDCNQAVAFLFDHAKQYGFDKKRVAIMGFSAGGHLASLQGLADNNQVASFYFNKKPRQFKFKGVVDFYGPSELVSLRSGEDAKSPEGILIGAAPVERPDLAKAASPITYIDKKDPPFLIIHGAKDDIVDPRQSKLLSGWLTVTGVKNELIIVPEAPHWGDVFDVEAVRVKVMAFLTDCLK